jgi:hypothetical protein
MTGLNAMEKPNDARARWTNEGMQNIPRCRLGVCKRRVGPEKINELRGLFLINQTINDNTYSEGGVQELT